MRRWMGTGTILKLLAGIGVGMGIRVAGMVGDGYEYLSPCSSLHQTRLVMLCSWEGNCRCSFAPATCHMSQT